MAGKVEVNTKDPIQPTSANSNLISRYTFELWVDSSINEDASIRVTFPPQWTDSTLGVAAGDCEGY